MRILYYLFLTYLILFPLGQLVRVPLVFLGPEVNLYLTDMLVGLISGGWLIWRLKKGSQKKPALFWPIFFFTFLAGLSLIVKTPLLENRELGVAGLYFLRWVAYAGLYFALFDLKKKFKDLSWPLIQKYLLGAGLSVAIFGWVQYFLWPDLRGFEVFNWDPHYYRLVSTFMDPGFTGLILALSLILLLPFWKKRKNLISFWVPGGMIYGALALTYSRSSYLVFLVGMGVLAWLKKTPRIFILSALLLAGTILLLPRPEGEGGKLSRFYSIEARVKNWQNSLVIFKDQPLTGVGFNAYRYAQRDYGFLDKEDWQKSHSGAGADSSLLLVLATSGVLGFAAYLWLWLKAIRGGAKGKLNYKIVILPTLGMVLIHSFFLNSLFYPWVMGWLWILLAYGE